MKNTYITFLTFALFFTLTASAQKIGIDIKQDWFAQVPTIDMAQLDTIIAYPLKGNLTDSKDIFVWYFKGGMDYQLKIYNNSNTSLVGDPYTFAPERWKLVEKQGTELYLVAKEHKDPRPFHKKISVYKLIQCRNDHNMLYKMIMVKQYNGRYPHQIKGPNLKN